MVARRFGRSHKRSWLAAAIISSALGWGAYQRTQQAPVVETLPEGTYRVERVVDGDTLQLANHARLRLIGVNTPETVKPEHPVEPWGKEASQFTRDFVAGGLVRLQLDRERLDRFGRHLAYVWVGERLLNEELLRAGLAHYEPQFHYSEAMKRRFRRAEQEAKDAKRGLWSG